VSAEPTAGSPATAAEPWPPGGSCRLIVARHGRTSWNDLGLFQGHADIPLDAEGERQAEQLAQALASFGPDRIAVSDLTRARQTAAPLVAATGVQPDVDARLREVDVGDWEGLTHQQVTALYADEYRAWAAGADLTRDGRETRAEGGRRAADAIVEHLQATGPGRLLVVVSHGLVLRVAMDELSARGVVETEGPTPPLGNTAWLDFEARPGQA